MVYSRKKLGFWLFLIAAVFVLGMNSEKVNAATASSSVKNFTVSSVTTNSVTFSWTKTNCSGYIIRYASGKWIKTITPSTKTSYTLKNLTPGTQYMVKIQSFNYKSSKSTKKLGSSYKYLTFVTRPNKPTETVTAGDGYLKVKWKLLDCDGYRLYRKEGKSGSWKLLKITSSTSYTDKKVTFGKTYYYKVKAYVKNGTSNLYGDYSSTKSGTPKKIITTTMPANKATLINSQTLSPALTHDPELDAKVADIISSITSSSMTKAQKLKACYDYLIYNYTYGYPSSWDMTCGKYTVRYGSNYDQTVYNYGKYTIYNKLGTCIGINSAFVILARRLGFEAVLEGGYIGNLGHYWANIKLGGNWYLFDPQVEQDCYKATGCSYIANWCWCEDLYWPCQNQGFGSWYSYDDEWGYRNGFTGFKNYSVHYN